MAKGGNFGKVCFFCNERLTANRPKNKHHILSRRYGKRSPIHYAHMDCQHRFNVEVDNPELEFIYYLVAMEVLHYGWGVFSPAVFFVMKGKVMFDYDVLKDSDAPRPPKPQSKIAGEVLAMLDALKNNETARVRIPEDMSSKGMRISFGRIATNNGRKVITWQVPAEPEFIYVKKVS